MKFALKVASPYPPSLARATGLALAQKGETVRIAFIDPLSGPFANVGPEPAQELAVRRPSACPAPRIRPASSSRSSASTTRARRRKA